MKVKLPNEEKPVDEILDGPNDDPNKDDLPKDPETPEQEPAEPIEPAEPTPSALELKVAHLEGKLDGMASAASKPAAGPTQDERDILAKNQFDIVLLDLSMPWFDGFHVLEDLRERKFKTPIIIIQCFN